VFVNAISKLLTVSIPCSVYAKAKIKCKNKSSPFSASIDFRVLLE
jgi:hypothetical protein